MVIFGAGASHGSRADDDVIDAGAVAGRRVYRPPVTAGLFDERFGEYASKYPSSRPAIVRLRQAPRDRPTLLIEQEIGNLYQEASTNPERVRQLLALRFYLQDLIESETNKWSELFHGITLYTNLLERLGTWRSRSREPIVLVTFNYDTLIDRSVEDQTANWHLTTFASHIKRDDWRLYKLHGSTAWRRDVPAAVSWTDPQAVISHADEIDVSRGHLIIAKTGELEQKAKRQAEFEDPDERTVQILGIAVPTSLKQTFECPTDHLRSFIAEIGKIDRLLTIGCRAAEPHAVELLAEHIRPGYELAICDIADHDVATIHANLALAGRRGRGPHAFVGGFEGLLSSDDLERWLELPIL